MDAGGSGQAMFQEVQYWELSKNPHVFNACNFEYCGLQRLVLASRNQLLSLGAEWGKFSLQELPLLGVPEDAEILSLGGFVTQVSGSPYEYFRDKEAEDKPIIVVAFMRGQDGDNIDGDPAVALGGSTSPPATPSSMMSSPSFSFSSSTNALGKPGPHAFSLETGTGFDAEVSFGGPPSAGTAGSGFRRENSAGSSSPSEVAAERQASQRYHLHIYSGLRPPQQQDGADDVADLAHVTQTQPQVADLDYIPLRLAHTILPVPFKEATNHYLVASGDDSKLHYFRQRKHPFAAPVQSAGFPEFDETAFASFGHTSAASAGADSKPRATHARKGVRESGSSKALRRLSRLSTQDASSTGQESAAEAGSLSASSSSSARSVEGDEETHDSEVANSLSASSAGSGDSGGSSDEAEGEDGEDDDDNDNDDEEEEEVDDDDDDDDDDVEEEDEDEDEEDDPGAAHAHHSRLMALVNENRRTRAASSLSSLSASQSSANEGGANNLGSDAGRRRALDSSSGSQLFEPIAAQRVPLGGFGDLSSPILSFQAQNLEASQSTQIFAGGCEDGTLRVVTKHLDRHGINDTALTARFNGPLPCLQFVESSRGVDCLDIVVGGSLGFAAVLEFDSANGGVALGRPALLPGSTEHDSVLCCKVADVNWDGREEILIGTYGQRLIAYGSVEEGAALQEGKPGQCAASPFAKTWERQFAFPVFSVESGDFNQDGAEELVINTLKGVHILQPDLSKAADAVELTVARLEQLRSLLA